MGIFQDVFDYVRFSMQGPNTNTENEAVSIVDAALAELPKVKVGWRSRLVIIRDVIKLKRMTNDQYTPGLRSYTSPLGGFSVTQDPVLWEEYKKVIDDNNKLKNFIRQFVSPLENGRVEEGRFYKLLQSMVQTKKNTDLRARIKGAKSKIQSLLRARPRQPGNAVENTNGFRAENAADTNVRQPEQKASGNIGGEAAIAAVSETQVGDKSSQAKTLALPTATRRSRVRGNAKPGLFSDERIAAENRKRILDLNEENAKKNKKEIEGLLREVPMPSKAATSTAQGLDPAQPRAVAPSLPSIPEAGDNRDVSNASEKKIRKVLEKNTQQPGKPVVPTEAHPQSEAVASPTDAQLRERRLKIWSGTRKRHSGK